MKGFAQDDAGVDVEISDGQSLRAKYLIGCDGGADPQGRRHRVPGIGSDNRGVIAEAELTEEPPEWGIRRDALGIHSLSRLEDGRRVRVLVTEQHVKVTTRTARSQRGAHRRIRDAVTGSTVPTSISGSPI